MPHILDELGNERNLGVYPITAAGPAEIDPPESIAWALDPHAPVPDEYRHLVNNPNEESTIDAQEEGT